MREIKFRGLHKDRWVYGWVSYDMPGTTAYYDKCSQRICWHDEEKGYCNAPVKNGTVGQYTGLKDKNGTEIYEGDKVKVTEEDGDTEIYEVRYMIEHDYPAFDLVPHLDCDSNGLSHVMAVCEIEVVGNIHDPELMEASS